MLKIDKSIINRVFKMRPIKGDQNIQNRLVGRTSSKEKTPILYRNFQTLKTHVNVGCEGGYDNDGQCYYRNRLVALRQRGLRSGFWYKVLNVLERAQINLTLRIVKHVKSRLLAQVLDSIIENLAFASRSRVEQATESLGVPLAVKASRIAKGWGYKNASSWCLDLKFARFLAIIQFNSVGGV